MYVQDFWRNTQILFIFIKSLYGGKCAEISWSNSRVDTLFFFMPKTARSKTHQQDVVHDEGTLIRWSMLRGLALKLNTLCWGFLIIYQRLLRYDFQFPFAILAPWLDVQGDPTLFSAPCSNWIYMCVMTWREIIQRMSYSSSQEKQCMNRFLSGWRTLNGNEIYFISYFINPGGEIRLCHPI